jgi:hypothetical protein
MTAKEQAIELYNNFCLALRFDETGDGYFTNIIQAKQCALICVNKIQEAIRYLNDQDSEFFWLEVKDEIEKL